MKNSKVLIVSLTELTCLRPLRTKCKTLVFSDVEKGRQFVKDNRSKVFHTQLAENIL